MTETTGSKQGSVTLRGVAIGLLMVAAIVGMTQVFSIQRSAAEVGGGAPPPAPTYLLFSYVLLAAPLLSRLSPRVALTKGELAIVYVMMLVAGPIAHPFSVGFLLPHTVAPYYFLQQEPTWELFSKSIPSWFGPADSETVTGFFHGTGGAVPWNAWLIPMLSWSSLLISLFFLMVCANSLISRQWIERERLVFPLTALPLALIEGVQKANPHSTNARRLLSQPLFWLGIAVPLLLQAPSALNRIYPVVPPFPLRELVLIDGQAQLSRPWNGLGQISISFIFWLIGVVYLLPKEVAFSAWVFYIIARLENVFAVMRGSVEAPSVYTNQFPALFAQGAGAALSLTVITLYNARRHLRVVFQNAFAKSEQGGGEFLSPRIAVLGGIAGVTFLIVWCWAAGMRFAVAALLFGLMLSYFFIFARIRAEVGLGMGVILWPKMLDEMMHTFIGARYLTLSELTLIQALRWMYFGSATGAVMACQLEGFKIIDGSGILRRGVGWTVALAATATVLLAFTWTLWSYYRTGFALMPIGQRGFSMVGSQIYWSYQNLVVTHNEPTGPQWDGIASIGAGAGVATVLSFLRASFTWFPLHPIGYLAANSWGMHINWMSFFVGWLIKTLIIRYGGLATYRRLLPMFLGLIVGDMLHQGVWGVVAWVTGYKPY